jgi:hypothetical protein
MRLFSIAPSVKKDYIHFMNYVVNYLDHPQKEIIEKRLEILKFYDEFGLEATRKAFKKGRSTIFLWKQKLAGSGGKLSASQVTGLRNTGVRGLLTHSLLNSLLTTVLITPG